MTAQYFFFDTYVGKFLQVIPIALLAGLVCALIRRRRGARLASGRSVACILFVCYLAGLLALTALPPNLIGELRYRILYHRPSGMSIRLLTFAYNVTPDFWRHFGRENLGNLALYLPMGVFLPLLWEKAEGWRTPALAFLFSLSVEALQLVTDRSFDVNDLILNTAGAVLGLLVFALFRTVFPAAVSRCREKG